METMRSCERDAGRFYTGGVWAAREGIGVEEVLQNAQSGRAFGLGAAAKTVLRKTFDARVR